MKRRMLLSLFIPMILYSRCSLANKLVPIDNLYRLDILMSKIREFSGNLEASIAVGERFLQLYPEKKETTHLMYGVGCNPRQVHTYSRLKFLKRRYQDYLLGNTLIVDGWVLAQAELCVCALVALYHSRLSCR